MLYRLSGLARIADSGQKSAFGLLPVTADTTPQHLKILYYLALDGIINLTLHMK